MILIPQLEMGSEQLNESPNITEQLIKEKESGSRSSSSRRLGPRMAQPGIQGPSAPPGGHHVTGAPILERPDSQPLTALRGSCSDLG